MDAVISCAARDKESNGSEGMKAIKKPVTIEFEFAKEDGVMETLEGRMRYKKGDAIITGVMGEKYPCRRDIFEQTYDIVSDLEASE